MVAEDTEGKQDFCGSVEQKCNKISKQSIMVILGDFNAKIGLEKFFKVTSYWATYEYM